MSPLLLLSVSSQPPPAIVPLSESALMLPVVVNGARLVIFPKDVRAVTLKPTPSGSVSRIGANDVVSAMRGQAFAGGAIPETSIDPFWFRTSTAPRMPTTVTGAKEVRSSTGPLIEVARTAPLALSASSSTRSARLPTAIEPNASDPLADIKNVWRRAGVMIAGRYFSSAEIEERLKGYAAEAP